MRIHRIIKLLNRFDESQQPSSGVAAEINMETKMGETGGNEVELVNIYTSNHFTKSLSK